MKCGRGSTQGVKGGARWTERTDLTDLTERIEQTEHAGRAGGWEQARPDTRSGYVLRNIN
jgi:hypothetical protein